MSSNQVSKNFNKPIKMNSKSSKPFQNTKLKKTTKSPNILSPSKILRQIKSQCSLIPGTSSRNSNKQLSGTDKLALTIKLKEHKIDLFQGSEDPSPIVMNNRKGFYSITEEEYKELGIFIKHLK